MAATLGFSNMSYSYPSLHSNSTMYQTSEFSYHDQPIHGSIHPIGSTEGYCQILSSSDHNKSEKPESSMIFWKIITSVRSVSFLDFLRFFGSVTTFSQVEERIISSTGTARICLYQYNYLTALRESASKLKTNEEHCRRIGFRTKSEIDVLDDGFKWRKYGKKAVKNSPNPRNYYRCTMEGCKVKKRVERDRNDPGYVITTYEGMHNHLSPGTVLYGNYNYNFPYRGD